jgi:D-methionine transport system substrate-binding protein
MKRIVTIAIAVLVSALVIAPVFAGKNDKGGALKVGATPEPHAELLNLIKGDLAKQGVTLEVIEFTDYVTPNEALESGQIDANYFQHIPYLEQFNTERGFHLVNAGGIHIEPIALYSRKYTSIGALPAGATVAIPNDPTNEARALLLLEAAGLITLKAGVGLSATPLDITANSKNLKFSEIEAASLPRVLPDVDAAVINGNYALAAGLNAKKDGLAVEGASSPYVNVVAVKVGNENDPQIKALVKALQSQKVKDYIANKYPNGDVVTVF